jgi:hypothetical protein
MRRLKEKNTPSKKIQKPKTACCISYLCPDPTIPHKVYLIDYGFLIKNGTIISIASEGLMDAAAQGFLHVDEDESYIP